MISARCLLLNDNFHYAHVSTQKFFSSFLDTVFHHLGLLRYPAFFPYLVFPLLRIPHTVPSSQYPYPSSIRTTLPNIHPCTHTENPQPSNLKNNTPLAHLHNLSLNCIVQFFFKCKSNKQKTKKKKKKKGWGNGGS